MVGRQQRSRRVVPAAARQVRRFEAFLKEDGLRRRSRGEGGQGRPVATVRLSIHSDWVTGDPSPMYGAMTSLSNCIDAFAAVRSSTSWWSMINWPSNQYWTTPSLTPLPAATEFILTNASTKCQLFL